jgi:predicted enzyme related to lactoylglutathione lyase
MERYIDFYSQVLGLKVQNRQEIKAQTQKSFSPKTPQQRMHA